MKHFLFLAIALISTSCTSLHVKTVIVTPEPHSVAIAPEQLPSPVKEESSAPRVEQVLTFEAPTNTSDVSYTDADVECMAVAIYHEARAESQTGQIAVGWVIMNRVKDKRFPKSVCNVVYQKRKNVCQFSWYCDNRSDVPKDQKSFNRARDLARAVIAGRVKNPIGKSIFFDSKQPRQKQQLLAMYRIGGHRFY